MSNNVFIRFLFMIIVQSTAKKDLSRNLLVKENGKELKSERGIIIGQRKYKL